jgi:hypothetical protein
VVDRFWGHDSAVVDENEDDENDEQVNGDEVLNGRPRYWPLWGCRDGSLLLLLM